jgi:hypothetical protein
MVLWPPRGGFPRIYKQGLIKLIARFAEVPNRFWKILGAVREDPGKFIATRLAEIFCYKIGVFFPATSHDSFKEVTSHKFVICDAQEFVAFHSIIGVQVTFGKVNVASTPHIDTQTQIAMDDSFNF